MYFKKYKIIIVGESNVGKTSIITKYLRRNIDNIENTIGTEYSNVNIEEYKQELQIWDCAGQEKFRSLVKLYFRGANICLFVFDLNDVKTLEGLKEYWIKYALSNINNKDCIYYLIGNKSDLEKNTNYHIVNNLCEILDGKYIETNIKNEYDIENLFKSITKRLYDNEIDKEIEKSECIKLEEIDYLDYKSCIC